ncbi:MAG: hypothetical protein F4100_02290 [Rhodothermaceae bacterium]|nr:hypothetical protein [Rhodothermaceae bacterium]MYE61995.1 hypothetical protein [Rhodothermaceae bacterium]MYJ19564.1 hypothetical protein [Rhodothermaceae bacterium]
MSAYTIGQRSSSMHIHFEPNLKHQSAAVDAVIRVFEGAPYTRQEEKLWAGDVSGNVLHIDAEKIRTNVAKLAEERNIEEYAPTDEPDFSIEMETGTGKTYVYIRTIFQLHKQYGLHKFMIVVPSVAIREGVLAALRDTRQHFREIYGEIASVIKYDSRRLPDVLNFCATNHLSVIVVNKQAFDSDSKIINADDRDSGNLLEQLQKVRPVIIMDEPQEGMDTPNMQKRLAAFNPLFKLRYSATHRYPKNVINRLTPYDAYNSGLVKKIAVLSIHETDTQSNVAIKFRRLNLVKGGPTASLLLNVRLKGGEVKEKPSTVRRLDDLVKKTNNPVYRGWVVEDIRTADVFGGEGYIKFDNGEVIYEGGTIGIDKEEIFRQQIRRSIQNHFHRKKQLVPMGIKPLVLFFIDRVANYIQPDGLIRRLFVEEYKNLYQHQYRQYPTNIDAVHGGYFAKTSKGKYSDHARSMEGERSKAIYDRILKEKMQLISFEDPLEFIFSHSALGVGWDNPNVFTICTLNESISQIKKRQEIGRGLRLCIRQDGRRYRDPEGTIEGQEINRLTVVPNESYQAFVITYQTELREELGEHAEAPEMRDENRTPVKIRRNDNRVRSKNFKHLWDQIAAETRCMVHFREKSLIEEGIKVLSEIRIAKNELNISLHRWSAIKNDVIEDELEGATHVNIKGQNAALNLVEELSRDTALATTTIAAILTGLPDAQLAMLARNPMKFVAEATRSLRRIVGQELVRLVHYEKTGRIPPLHEFFGAEEETRRKLTPTPKRGLYDHIIPESDEERDMAIIFDSHSTVRLFLKLPKKYKIPTPIGNYTPDFALVMEKRDLDNPDAEARFYFVVEIKGTSELCKLRPDEQMKIQFAIKHFEALGMGSYLAPVNNTEAFDDKAFAAVEETFFDQ